MKVLVCLLLLLLVALTQCKPIKVNVVDFPKDHQQQQQQVAVDRPTVAKQFSTNFQISAIDWVQSGPTFNGTLALDDVSGGGKLSFGGVEFIPVYLHFNAIANPKANPGMVTGFMFEGDICWFQEVPRDWLQLYPLAIPQNATYMGNAFINGISCTGWEWVSTDVYAGLTLQMWVSQTVTPYGNAIVEFDILQVPYGVGDIKWSFSDTTPGPIDPHTYDPPKMNCIPPPFDAAKRASGLMNPVTMLINALRTAM